MLSEHKAKPINLLHVKLSQINKILVKIRSERAQHVPYKEQLKVGEAGCREADNHWSTDWTNTALSSTRRNNFNNNRDKYSDGQRSVGWKYLSIHKLQWLHRSSGMDKWFYSTLYIVCNSWPMPDYR